MRLGGLTASSPNIPPAHYPGRLKEGFTGIDMEQYTREREEATTDQGAMEWACDMNTRLERQGGQYKYGQNIEHGAVLESSVAEVTWDVDGGTVRQEDGDIVSIAELFMRTLNTTRWKPPPCSLSLMVSSPTRTEQIKI